MGVRAGKGDGLSGDLTVDPELHEYRVDGVVIPSVTQVLDETLGVQWRAGDWYLQRGHAVHACAALIAKGKTFKHDPAVDGQVSACRKFFSDHKPEVLSVEGIGYHPLYRYAGTPDMLCRMMGKVVVLDWKATIPDTVEIQLAAYSLLQKPVVKWGLAVALHDDGTYKIGGLFDLRYPSNTFLSCLTVYNIRKKLGRINKKEK